MIPMYFFIITIDKKQKYDIVRNEDDSALDAKSYQTDLFDNLIE